MDLHNKAVKLHFDSLARKREDYLKKNWYYHQSVENLCAFFVPEHSNVLQLGSGNGGLLAHLKPVYGVGVDISGSRVKNAQKKYNSLTFLNKDIQKLSIKKKFDYVICSDVIGYLSDVQQAFEQIKKVSTPQSRIIITYYNFLWEPLLILAEKIGVKFPIPPQNWLSMTDIKNLLDLAGLEVVKSGNYLLIPFYIPFLSNFINRYIARLPLIKQLCLVQYVIARTKPTLQDKRKYSVSVILQLFLGLELEENIFGDLLKI